MHLRSRKTGNDFQKTLINDDDNNDKIAKNILVKGSKLRYTLAICAFIWICLTLAWCNSYTDSYPPVRSSDDKTLFSEERARKFLKQITSFGPRPTGSYAAEKQSVDLFLSTFEELDNKFKKTDKNRLEYDIQRPSDCFDVSFRGYFTLCYYNVTNIVARIGPKSGPSNHALMLNCHFDTVFDSPGATDDAVSCSIMIELMTVLANYQESLKYDVVFLFNGAEEYGLHASHGFITQHPWRHYIRAFINLEGAGSSGREVLFQAGPKHSWLLHSYLKHAPYPYCSVLGQEVFQSGIIPSDTDFRIFRDFGGLSGLDIAYVVNGWLYHTEFDKEEKIAHGAIQRAGDNIYSIILSVMNSPYLEEPWKYEESTKWIYYDILGLFTIYYSVNIGEIINFLLVIITLLIIGYRIRFNVYNAKDILGALANHAIVFVVMLLGLVGICSTLYLFGLSQIWWKEPNFIYIFFIVPLIVIGHKVHTFLQNDYDGSNYWAKQDKYVDSIMIVLSAFLCFLTFKGIASAYVFFNFLFVIILSQFITKLFVCKDNIINRSIIGLICLSPTLIYFSYVVLQLLQLYVPVTGRSGTKLNPIFIIGALSLLAAYVYVMCTSYMVLFNENFHKIKMMKYFLIIYFFLILFTYNNMNSPYSYSYEHPRLRRMLGIHTERTIFNMNNELINEENAVFIQGLDFNNVQNLPDHPVFKNAVTPDCSNISDSYCRLPYYNSVFNSYPPHETLWTEIEGKPEISKRIKMQLFDKKVVNDSLVVCNFSLIGELGRASLHITPLHDYELYAWSMSKIDLDVYGRRPTYFVTLTQGSNEIVERTFSISLIKKNGESANLNDPVVEIAFVSLLESPLNPKKKSVFEEFKYRARERTSNNWEMAYIFAESQTIIRTI